MKVQVDSIFGGKAMGGIARTLLANNMDVNKLRANDTTLRYDEWKLYDKAIVDIARPALVAVNDLRSRNLVYNVDGMAATVLTWETGSDLEPAQVHMTPRARARNDQVKYSMNYLPLPIVHAGYSIDIRKLNESRRGGQGIDVAQAEIAAKLVADQVEQILLNGYDFQYGGGTIYGFLTPPAADTGSLVHAWDASAATGETIVADVNAMIQESIDAYCYGPWGIYIPQSYASKMNADYKANSSDTIRQRIEAIEGIEFCKVAPRLTDGRVVLVPLTKDRTELVIGMDIMNVPWESPGGFELHNEVMAIMVPRLKADQNSNSGFVVYSE